MDAKWMPVFAAAVGVIGGVGGALVGGSLANSAEQERLEDERRDAREDLFRATHGEFLGAADSFFISRGRGLQQGRGDYHPGRGCPDNRRRPAPSP
jgi:hypothetical protein